MLLKRYNTFAFSEEGPNSSHSEGEVAHNDEDMTEMSAALKKRLKKVTKYKICMCQIHVIMVFMDLEYIWGGGGGLGHIELMIYIYVQCI